jgi:hypothetical protein
MTESTGETAQGTRTRFAGRSSSGRYSAANVQIFGRCAVGLDAENAELCVG